MVLQVVIIPDFFPPGHLVNQRVCVQLPLGWYWIQSIMKSYLRSLSEYVQVDVFNIRMPVCLNTKMYSTSVHVITKKLVSIWLSSCLLCLRWDATYRQLHSSHMCWEIHIVLESSGAKDFKEYWWDEMNTRDTFDLLSTIHCALFITFE